MNRSDGRVGVLPLVCAVCERTVGVINVPALATMLSTDEIYVCQTCAAQKESTIEQVLSGQPARYYASLVHQAISAMRA